MVERVLAFSQFLGSQDSASPVYPHPISTVTHSGCFGERRCGGSRQEAGGVRDAAHAHTAAGAGEGREERGEALEGVGTEGLARAGRHGVCTRLCAALKCPALWGSRTEPRARAESPSVSLLPPQP